jgi:hypothetical protein
MALFLGSLSLKDRQFSHLDLFMSDPLGFILRMEAKSTGECRQLKFMSQFRVMPCIGKGMAWCNN